MEKYKNYDVDSLCRACLEILNDPQKTYHLFHTPDLAKKLILCTSLCVETNDELSKNLCDSCFHKVDELHQFQQMCVDSAQKYQEFLDNQIKANTKENYFEEIRFIEKVEVVLAEEATCTEKDNLEFCSDEKLTEDPVLKKEKDDEEYLSEEGRNFDGNDYNTTDDDLNDETFIPLKKSHHKTSNQVHAKKSHRNQKESQEEDKKQTKSIVYTCDICPKRFFLERRLIAHKRTHQGLLPYPCTYSNCEKVFKRYEGLVEHIKLHEGYNYFACEEEGCGKLYKNRSSLEMHLRKFHKKGPEVIPWICEICGKIFTLLRKLQAHKFVHKEKSELPFVCPENGCEKRFSVKENLRVHLMRHAGIKNYVCPHCGMRKTTRKELKVHINYHTLEKTWSCRFCDHVSNSAGNLRMHVRTIHEQSKNFMCKFCERTFANSYTRKYHEMTHTGEKPHECSQCGKCFRQPAALRAHKQFHLKQKLKEEVNKISRSVDDKEEKIIVVRKQRRPKTLVKSELPDIVHVDN